MTARHLVAALVMALLFCPPLKAQDNPLVQRGIPAEATAENAVTARDRAHANARRIAFQRMAEALGGGIATPSDAQLERMVAALIVENERTSSTRYSGQLTVQFSPGQVASLTGRSFSGSGAASGGGSAPGSMGLNIPMAAQSYVEATTRFNSFQEWLELRRRLRASNIVASVDLVAISPDAARMRLGLRQQAGEAAASLGAVGVSVSQEGNRWQVGLGGG
ncbi:hypothetical protein [Roseococcus sp.]|uniref:hypothetical protein n=1 Tax=Roseococcus sp. TaxID=2109646 RepID=UPI003BA879EA